MASTEVPMVHYPVDDITKKIDCELHVPMKNISMKVAVGYVLPSGPGQTWHGREIRPGYAKVGVDAIERGYESLLLDVAGPEEEEKLGEVLGGIILWDKKHIVFPGSAPRRPPSPPSPRNSPPPDDDRDDYHHTPSPHRSPPQCQPPPPPPPPQPTRKSQSCGKSAAMSTSNVSPKKRAKIAKAVPPPPIEKTAEEIEAEDRAKVKRKLAALRPTPTPKQVYTLEQKEWAFDMLTQPSQYELRKPDDYKRCLDKQVDAKKEANKTSATARGKRDVAQLGAQTKKSISPLKVFASDAGGSVAQPNPADFAKEAGLTLSQLLDEGITPKAPIARQYEKGKSLVPPEIEMNLPTQMRKLHKWYLQAAKGTQDFLLMQITKDHFLGQDLVHIEFDEFFQLFNQDALDKSLVSAYVL